jgi:hypothetical protein
MNAWLVGVLLLSGIVLGVLGVILSGKTRVPRWARILIVLALVLFGLLVVGDLIGGLLGYSSIYSSVQNTGYFENDYLTKMVALVLAFSFYLTLGFAGRFFWHLKWQKAVSCLIAWLFVYFGAMAIMTNGQIFSNDGPEKSYVRLPATEQFPKGEILLMDKNLKQDRYYGIEGKKPDTEIMKEYYGQHPDRRSESIAQQVKQQEEKAALEQERLDLQKQRDGLARQKAELQEKDLPTHKDSHPSNKTAQFAQQQIIPKEQQQKPQPRILTARLRNLVFTIDALNACRRIDETIRCTGTVANKGDIADSFSLPLANEFFLGQIKVRNQFGEQYILAQSNCSSKTDYNTNHFNGVLTFQIQHCSQYLEPNTFETFDFSVNGVSEDVTKIRLEIDPLDLSFWPISIPTQ